MSSAREKGEAARVGNNMSPTTRKRKNRDYVPYVLEAVKMLAGGNGHGASRQNIVKYVEGSLNEETNGVRNLSSQLVKAAIMKALNSGLLVHASGVGLNGSYVIPEKLKNASAVNSCDKEKPVTTKEAKLRNISSLASEFHDPPALENPAKTVTNKRQRITKLVVPFAQVELVKGNQFESAEKSTALKAILKRPKEEVVTAKLRRKRKVKFCSPPRILFISPCIKRRSKRKM